MINGHATARIHHEFYLFGCVPTAYHHRSAAGPGRRRTGPEAMTDLRRLAAEAYIWAAPLIGAARLRRNATRPDQPWIARSPSAAAAPINRFGHQSVLSDPAFTVGVAPNVDTLYSVAWLDTAHGPFRFEAPSFGERYYTFQFGEADTECRWCLGQRTHGARLPPVVVIGPDDDSPVAPDALVVRSRARHLMIAGRVLVDPADRDDLECVRALQRAMRIVRVDGDEPPVSAQVPVPTGSEVVDPPLLPLFQIDALVAESALGRTDRSRLTRFQPLGVGLGRRFDPAAFDEPSRNEVADGLADGAQAVDARVDQLGEPVNGWSTNLRGPDFGDDLLLRAAVAQNQIYVVPPQEAVYPVTRVDAHGRRLRGDSTYAIRFDRPPPAGAFWSLTMYGTPGPLVDNPIGRYAIGDRTAGLQHADDGSLTITIATSEPAAGAPNWLPCPTGEFHLMLRLYWPDPSILAGIWTPPAVTPVDGPAATDHAPTPTKRDVP